MDAISVLVMVAAGAAVGLLAGFLGIGGTPLIAPAVFLALSRLPASETIALRTSFGTALAAAGLIAAAGYVVHRRHLRGRGSLAYALGPTVAIGAFAGGSVGGLLSADALRAAFAAGTLLIAAWMFFSREKEAIAERAPHPWVVAAVGLGIGFFAALAGMGGAVFSIIVLVNLFGFSMRSVTETSSFVQICGALSACVGYAVIGWQDPGLIPHSLGYVNLPAAACVAASGLPAAIIGARLTHVAASGIARRIFAVLLVALALHMARVF